MMRAYTSLWFGASCLLTTMGCAEADLYDDAPFLYENRERDAGPTNCELEGVWAVTLSTSGECAPQEGAAVITLTVRDSSDFATGEAAPTSSCGKDYSRTVDIAANGCTITASSLATWCSDDRPQCTDYQLTLHVHGDTADVDGTYRKCWCGSPSAFGKKAYIAGSATRQ